MGSGRTRVCIHRGAREVGGSCVELESGGARLLLDLGLPLAVDADRSVALPGVSGLVEPDPSLLGVVVSHAHLDHYGFLPLARADLPVYIGEAGARILEEAAFFSPSGLASENRFSILQRRAPELARELDELAQKDVDERWRVYRALAEMSQVPSEPTATSIADGVESAV